MTNFDKIKNMTVEEMAQWLFSLGVLSGTYMGSISLGDIVKLLLHTSYE